MAGLGGGEGADLVMQKLELEMVWRHRVSWTMVKFLTLSSVATWDAVCWSILEGRKSERKDAQLPHSQQRALAHSFS